MKIKIVIDTRKAESDELMNTRSQVWEGELEILDKTEYLMTISMLGEGQPQPLCMVPFAIGVGHYMWIPPDDMVERSLGEYDV